MISRIESPACANGAATMRASVSKEAKYLPRIMKPT
jgi:hypothetical protein